MKTIIEDRSIYLPDAGSTVAAGEGLAPGLRGGMIVTLSGELGAGKTTLVRGMLRGLGWAGAVKSPTYALVEHYMFSSLYFYHFDFYRFDSADEWDTSGFAEYFHEAAICVIEWPERVASRLPLVDLALLLEPSGAGRTLSLTARTPPGSTCLAAFGPHPH
jgi:tRNA threonylcarbamoyladenosine biosynthesis protein TsaE